MDLSQLGQNDDTMATRRGGSNRTGYFVFDELYKQSRFLFPSSR
jgi:hypothetical protein